MSLRRKVLLLLTALCSVAPVAPASATSAMACTGVWSWDFNPPLGVPHTQTFGTVTVYTEFPHNTCANVADTCPGQLACSWTAIGWSGTLTAPYAGNCLSATVFMSSGPAFIVAGAATVHPGPDYHLAGTLANLCALDPATGAVAWVGART